MLISNTGVTNNSMVIRQARINDEQEILSIIDSHAYKWDKKPAKKYYDDYFSKKDDCLKGDNVYVGIIDNKIVGVIGYYIDRYETNHYWLGWFYIDKQFTNQGYGKQLLEHITKELKDKGVKRLFVNTSSHHYFDVALQFYLKNKFRIEAVIKDYYWEGEDQYILSRNL
jgi:GNAT superfamily N-acetyltransferase